MKARYESAVINGVVAARIMVGLMLLASKQSIMVQVSAMSDAR